MRRWFTAALDAVLPHTCLACSAVQGAPGLCARCWARMPWIAAPLCDGCGAPFGLGPGDGGRQLRCVTCSTAPPLVGAARAALRYDDDSRPLVLGFKHADRLHGAPSLAGWLCRAGADLLPAADLIAPVPLHWSRLAWRRYNQSAVLARLVARSSGKPYVADLLVRRRRTVSQAGLSRDGRRRNVAAAFALGRRHRAGVVGRRVLLVDDVITTGSTLSACARVLLAAGALAVDGLALARVVDPLAGDLVAGTPQTSDLSSPPP